MRWNEIRHLLVSLLSLQQKLSKNLRDFGSAVQMQYSDTEWPKRWATTMNHICIIIMDSNIAAYNDGAGSIVIWTPKLAQNSEFALLMSTFSSKTTETILFWQYRMTQRLDYESPVIRIAILLIGHIVCMGSSVAVWVDGAVLIVQNLPWLAHSCPSDSQKPQNQ